MFTLVISTSILTWSFYSEIIPCFQDQTADAVFALLPLFFLFQDAEGFDGKSGANFFRDDGTIAKSRIRIRPHCFAGGVSCPCLQQERFHPFVADYSAG